MAGRDALEREVAAILRIGSSLDLDTVLREAVDSARALTGARYGMIATVDETGAIDEREHGNRWCGFHGICRETDSGEGRTVTLQPRGHGVG